jgi:hypothetical protein
LPSEKGECDVKAVDEAATVEMAPPPPNELVHDVVGNLERDEEPDPVIDLDGSSWRHVGV